MVDNKNLRKRPDETYRQGVLKIETEYVYLLRAFKYYKQLFATNKSRIDMINTFGTNFFLMFQYVFFNFFIAVRIPSLCEKYEAGSNKNLTLAYLIEKSPNRLSDKVNTIFKKILNANKSIKIYRDKAIAHIDFNKHSEVKLDTDLKKIEIIISDMGELLTIIKSINLGVHTSYEFHLHPRTDALSVLQAIEHSVKYKELVEVIKRLPESSIPEFQKIQKTHQRQLMYSNELQKEDF